ncbi:hypothetical protein OUHCRE19_38980 [Enterobacter asburiae]
MKSAKFRGVHSIYNNHYVMKTSAEAALWGGLRPAGCQDPPGMGGEENVGNDSNLLIVFYVQIMPDDFVMQLHRF